MDLRNHTDPFGRSLPFCMQNKYKIFINLPIVIFAVECRSLLHRATQASLRQPSQTLNLRCAAIIKSISDAVM
jgi:hypothetical protein